MLSRSFLLLFILVPAFTFAQKDDRKGTYGSFGIGYASYKLDLYRYAGGSNLYTDQKFSGPLVSLGLERKSAWSVNDFVFDISGDLTAGFGIKSSINGTGGGTASFSGGSLYGIKALFKAGYLIPNSDKTFIPVIGLGPYYTYINPGHDLDGNYIYGLQASIGADLIASSFVLTPEIHFGLASWGSSDSFDQNGQPGMFEIKLKIARKFW